MTYPKFEEIWQNKFRNAQETPSEVVWEAIAWQIGYKERQRRRWIAWWAAALIAFFLGDGRLVYNFYGKFFEYQIEAIAEAIPETETRDNKNAQTLVNKQKQRKISVTLLSPYANHQEAPNFFVAEAAYELAEDKIASKRPQEEIPQEILGKPKKRAWWLKSYANSQHIQSIYTYKPNLPLIASRMMPNLQSVQREQNIQKEIASFRHIFTWGAGLELGWQFHKNFYVSSGMHFQRSLFSFESNSHRPELATFWGRLPEITQPNSIVATSPTIIETAILEESTSSGIGANKPTTLSTYRFTQKMDYLSIPIKLGYQKVEHRWQYGAALGLENSFLLSNTFKNSEENFGQVMQNANRLQVAALAEISVGFRLNHKTTLHISPVYRQFLTSPLAKNPDLQINKNSLGIGAGLQIGL